MSNAARNRAKFVTIQIFFAPKTSITGCAYYVRPIYVADRLARAINLIGDLILGVQKPEVQPEVLLTQSSDAFKAINRGHFDLDRPTCYAIKIALKCSIIDAGELSVCDIIHNGGGQTGSRNNC